MRNKEQIITQTMDMYYSGMSFRKIADPKYNVLGIDYIYLEQFWKQAYRDGFVRARTDEIAFLTDFLKDVSDTGSICLTEESIKNRLSKLNLEREK